MKKHTRITLLIFLIFTAVTFIPLFTVPLVQGTKIDSDRTYFSSHPRKRAYYRLVVTKGNYYEFTLDWDSYHYRPILELYSRSFKLIGKDVFNLGSYQTELSVQFHAKHNGFYYVTVDQSDDCSFRIHLDEISGSGFTTFNSFIDFNSRMVYIMITYVVLSLCIVISSYSAKIAQRRREAEARDRFFDCPRCSVTTEKGTEYCMYCGYTFKTPKIKQT